MIRLASLPLVLFVGLGTAACGGGKGAEQAPVAEAPAISVPLTVVADGPTPKVVSVTGTVEADESSDVAASVAGKVIAILVDNGARVKKGDPLLRLDTRNAQLSSREIKANVAAAKIQQTLANEQCTRATQLLAKGAITQAEFDQTQANCAASAQQVAGASARAAMAGQQMSDGVVRAPFDGLVTNKTIALGEWVGPGSRLLTVVDDDPLLVALSIPESDVPKIKLGQSLVVRSVAFESAPITASVTMIDAEIGRMSRSLRVEATLSPGTELRPGVFVRADLNVGTELLPVVPSTAVVKRGQTFRAFVAVNGQLEERIVQLGPEPGPGQVSIRRGVVAGEKIATTINDTVVDGARLQ